MDPIKRSAREVWLRVRNAEKGYRRQLVSVARQLGIIVRGFAPAGEISDLPLLMETLGKYEAVLEPWAQTVAARMLADVNLRDKNAWHSTAVEIGQILRDEIENAPTGQVMRELLDIQVMQIKSIPRAAAERLMALATEAHVSGGRAEAIRRQIMATEGVSASHAAMLAKTAVSTASTTLVEARALYVGSPGYFWRTSKNESVREDHRELEGTFHRWDEPPVVDKKTGFRSHPGCNANCQCWAQVMLPEPDLS